MGQCHTREQRNAQNFLVGKSGENKLLEKLRRGWKDDIKRILKKYGVRTCTVFTWMRQGLVEGFCAQGNGPPVSLNAGIFE